MKTKILILITAMLLGACGQRISSSESQAIAPEISQPAVKRQSAYASSTPQIAPADDRALRAPPDYKDSSARLDRSK